MWLLPRSDRVRGIRGELLAFTDADCLPDPDWIARGVRARKPGDRRAPGRYRGRRVVPEPRESPVVLFVEDERSIAEPFSPRAAPWGSSRCRRAAAPRRWPWPARTNPTSCCSTWRCPTATGATCAASCAAPPTCRSSCSPPAAPRPIASSGSSSAPTTTSSSRSAAARSSPASARCCAAARGAAQPRRADRARSACASTRARARASLRRREPRAQRKEFDLLARLTRDAGRW